MTRIGIEQIVFDVHVGVTEEERSVPQQISTDIELMGQINTQCDQLDQTIDYDAVCRNMITAGQSMRPLLIETLAEKMAQVALAEPRVESVRIRVRKCHPPLKEIRGGFVVELQRP